jgi:23S rRNA (adenine2503-C2)-methyltransferase
MGAVTFDPLRTWHDAAAARIGLPDAQALADRFALKPYRLRQIYRAAVKELLPEIDAVTTLPKEVRAALKESGYGFDAVEPAAILHSNDGQTTKGLFRLRDGSAVEAVLMEHLGGRTTVCISSQAGCAFACAFCATGQGGFGRHLSAVEIFDQARWFARELTSRGKRVTNVVFMGMGEPFHNYDAVMQAVALLNDPHGFGLGHRHITISTVGLVPAIDRFAGEGIQVNLAISLHAPDDEIRARIMPVNRRYGVADLMAACERYVRATNRKVFFEYVMLAGVNDDDACAHRLARLMRGRLYHVNLIPYNTTPDGPFEGSDERRIRAFAAILEAEGVPVTVRRTMGSDIAAACGQLRVEDQRRARAARTA